MTTTAEEIHHIVRNADTLIRSTTCHQCPAAVGLIRDLIAVVVQLARERDEAIVRLTAERDEAKLAASLAQGRH